MAAAYQGFTKRQKLCVVGGAIFAVFVSLAFAAWIMGDALRNMQFNQRDQEVVNRLLGDTTDPLHKSMLRAHAIDTVANLKQIANRQSIIIVAFAGAFALCAIGFALFLLGADNALQLQTEPGRDGLKLLLAGTAPGMLCFVLAIILAGVALAHRSSINFAPVNFPRQITGSPEVSPLRSPEGANGASQAEARKAKESAEQGNVEREAQSRAAEKAAAAKLAAEKIAADKLIAGELAAAKSAAEKAAIARLAAENAAADKLAAETAAADKWAAERSAADKLAADKALEKKWMADRAAADKLAIDKAKAAKAAADKRLADKAAASKLAADKAAASKLAAEKAAEQKWAAANTGAAKAASDRHAAERLILEKARADKAVAEKLAADKAASTKLASDKALAIKQAVDKAANDTSRAEKLAAERGDVANLIAEKIAAAGAPSEMYKRALALRIDGETSQALALLKYASSAGHGPSSRLLAALYKNGAPDVRANFRQAERYQALADSQADR